MDGHADRAALVGDRARDGLADPPRRVGRELEALAVVELLGRAHEPDRPLLDQVEERQPLVAVALGDRDDEPEVGLDHRLLGGVVAALDPLRELDLLRGGQQRHLADVLQEELQRVGRDLRLGSPTPARAPLLGLLGRADDLDLRLVERRVELVELRRRRGRARRARARSPPRRGVRRRDRPRAASSPRPSRGRPRRRIGLATTGVRRWHARAPFRSARDGKVAAGDRRSSKSAASAVSDACLGGELSSVRRASRAIGEPGSSGREPELTPCLLHLTRPEEQQPEVEADGRGAWEPARERPEPGERERRVGLVEATDRGGDQRLGFGRARRAASSKTRRAETRRPAPLQPDAVQQPSASSRRAPGPGARSCCGAVGAAITAAGAENDGTNCGSPRAKSGCSRPSASTAYGVSGSTSAASRHASSAPAQPCPEAGEPEVELDDARCAGRGAASWASRSAEPSGHEAIAAPTFASSESYRGRRCSASSRRSSLTSCSARRRATASGSARSPSSSASGGPPGRGDVTGGGAAVPVGPLWAATTAATPPAARTATTAVIVTTRGEGTRGTMSRPRGVARGGPARAGRYTSESNAELQGTSRLAPRRPSRDRDGRRARAGRRRRRRAALRRRPRARRVAGGAHPRRDPPPAQQPRVARRDADPRQEPRADRLLRERDALGLRRGVAQGARLRAAVALPRRFRRVEAVRLRLRRSRGR